MEPFLELAYIIGVALIVSVLMRLLKQPLIVGYIITGLLVGPQFLGIYRGGDAIDTFAHLGVALLLFLVGLNLNPQTIKETGKASLLTGLGQIAFTSLIGYGLGILMGFDSATSFYLAVGLAFSSTIIISKLLYDKGDIQTLYGRISIGFLIIQDLVAIALLVLISGRPALILQDIGILVVVGVGAYFLLPRIMPFIAKSQELLLVFSLAWCLLLAALFQAAGLSLEAGALLAGIGLSLSQYRHEIAARLRPIRDFLLLLFFVMLSTQMAFSEISLGAVLLFSLFILIGNPLIVMVLLSMLGYSGRTGFKAGLTVAQISEFSLIIIALGVSLGHVDQTLLSLATVVGVITIAGSTYLILYADRIYQTLEPLLRFLEREHTTPRTHRHDIILFGCNRVGNALLHSFKKLKHAFFVVDYDPETIARLVNEGVSAQYGDAADPELLQSLQLKSVKMVVSTILDLDVNLIILNTIQREKSSAVFAAVATSTSDALELYEAGASYVLVPHDVGGKHISALIDQHGVDPAKYLQEKIAHIEHLKGRHTAK